MSAARGYVLLFALGLIVVVATLVLSLSIAMRLDAQLLSGTKVSSQEEYLMRGATQYAATQLGITAAVDRLRLDPKSDVLRDWRLWRPSVQAQDLQIGESRVTVTMEDVSDVPDANRLSQQQWERLLELNGLKAEAAQKLAEKIVALRAGLSRARGSAGFADHAELMAWSAIPQDVGKFVVVGTNRAEVNLNSTPVKTLQFLGNVSAVKLEQLEKMRQAGVIAPAQAQAWIQGTGLNLSQVAGEVLAVKAYVRMSATGPERWSWVALITGENGKYKVVDQALARQRAIP